MATPKHVAVTLPTDKVPTKPMVRDIIGAFLPQEWSTLDPSTLEMTHRVNAGNAHCPVSRLTTTGKTSLEPSHVFLKFHERPNSTIDIFASLAPTKAQEALLCHELAQLGSGYGASVHGFFVTEDGTMGRVDEFLDARTLEAGDVEDGEMRAAIAKAMASFAALNSAALERPVAAYYGALVPGLRRYHGLERLKVLAREGGISLDGLVDYDFASRVKIVVKAMEAMEAKAGWCIHDVQYMNVMVRDYPRPDENKVALIDFELVMRNYRGFDIGGHFMQKMFKWFDEESKIVNCRNYVDEEKRHFCDEYAKEWNRVTGDADTGEQVLLEAEYGYLLAITFDVHNMLWFMDKTDAKDPLDLEGLNRLYDEFVGQYRKLGLEP